MPATSSTNDCDDSNTIYYLPLDFVPGPNHVVCARGKVFWDHSGNQRYRKIIAAATKKYARATNKLDKSLIVSEIVEQFQRHPNNNNNDNNNNNNNKHFSNDQVTGHRGGFVKRETTKNGQQRFFLADENFVREKVGQSLRDSLHGQYKSSTKAKQSKKSKVTSKVDVDVYHVIHSNREVSRLIEQLQTDAKQIKEDESTIPNEDDVSSMFLRANLDILERMKQDESLLNQFQHATTMATIEASS